MDVQPLLAGEPSRVGDYRLLARLGKGSMGSVYLARSRGGRTVAVKVVRSDLAEDPQFRERFRREAAISRTVGGFWTAAVVDADPEAEQPWLATEYVPGPTLHQAVAENGPLPEQTVGALAAGLAEALGAIHAADLVHRDLKPANVLIGPDGPRVIDFGISRVMSSSAMTATGTFFGTPGYFSPEQTEGSEVGPASDVFSLGAVLVFAATGHGPFGEDGTVAMLYRVVNSEPEVGDVPASLRPLVAACLAKKPAERPTPTMILDRVGGAGPQGRQWLPAQVTALIDENTTRLQSMDEVVPATPEPQSPRPPTRAYDPVLPEPPVAPPPRQAEAAGPSHPRTASSKPAGAPLVRKDNPGAVFRTGRRSGAVAYAAMVFLLAYGAYASRGAIEIAENARVIFLLGVGCLVLSGVLSLVRALLPGLRLKVNSDGLLVSRVGLSRQIPWNHVSRVGLVGSGKKQTVAVWVAAGTPAPRSTWWHRVRGYHGGTKVFPVGSTGGLWTRRWQAKRMRDALYRYAPRVYDARLL
ncbi:serine/threonine protein kinase [Saccharopolyspora lacisalsi]|uniref:Serine/threonine protein kinase n=1 Tax=Halosaccharopolyspora lacisalsi TaxID=1000566 RepID=A0A839DXY1_9PSEU|nr:serine/threonine-protein kinase [Halosaccharopolyspora lacisalsi]MBA8825730.1 serine/threonine protein kinase [Halosaccharopolyspora lacisalsi]